MKLVLSVGLVLGIALATAPPARADEARDQKARELYRLGKEAYTKGEYQAAYDNFRESFQLSHQPALLYNVASALQGLRRPHDAAEALRSYLRLKPDDTDKPQIEERIRTLEEEQRLIDLESRPQVPEPPKPAVTPPPPLPAPNQTVVLMTPAPPPEPSPRDRARRRTAIIVGVTVGAVVIAGVAVGLALGLQTKEEPLTPSPIGPIKSTQ